jgi:hypothetical protein
VTLNSCPNYIRKEYDSRNDIENTFEDQTEVDFTKDRPNCRIRRQFSETKKIKIFEAQVRVSIKHQAMLRQAMYETNKRKAFALIYEQCHKTLQAKLKAREKYDTEIKGDPIAMLKAIQEHTLSYQEIVIDSLRNLLNTKHQDDEDLVDFTRRFKAARDFHESQVGTKMKIKKMAKIDKEWDDKDDKIMKQCFDRASARCMALLLIPNSTGSNSNGVQVVTCDL